MLKVIEYICCIPVVSLSVGYIAEMILQKKGKKE